MEGFDMKLLKKGIGYNASCYYLELHKDYYGVTDIKQVGDWTVFYNNNKIVAKYNEKKDVLMGI